jgi:hypothetical protein
MSDIVQLHSPIDTNTDLGRELIVDCARFREGILDEKAIRKKYRFDEAAWEALGNDEMVRAIEEESVRRIRDGSSKREKAQLLVVRAPDVVAKIMNDDSANARHRIDSAKTLNDFAANPPGQNAPSGDRFVIQINLGEDVIRFNKSIAPNPHDIDPDNPDTTNVIAAIATKKLPDGGNGEPV